jgi:hypothetical protein
VGCHKDGFRQCHGVDENIGLVAEIQ